MLKLFNNCKLNLITSPIFIRYTISKTIFLTIEWFKVELDYIIIQRNNTSTLLTALKHWHFTRKFTLDLSLDDPRVSSILSDLSLVHLMIKHILFYWWSILRKLSYYIISYLKYLLDAKLFWLYDYNTIQ